MAYIPPHKRHTKEGESSKPVIPELLTSDFREKLKFRNARGKKSVYGWEIAYAKHSISKWWPAGSKDDDPIPSNFCLEPFSCLNVDNQAMGERHVLVARAITAERNEASDNSEKEPWVSITKKILPDLLPSLTNLRDEIQSGSEGIKPSFVARVGKILFHGDLIDSIRKAASSESDCRGQIHKSFRTNIPNGYMEDIENQVVPKIGIKFDSVKEHYHVKVLDSSQPDCVISCKCIVREDGKTLEAYKFEQNQVRHLVVDISCLYKDLDLRLMLSSKRVLRDLDGEEKGWLNKLINAAILDKDIKGGLRWPLGKESVGGRFSVVGAWHTKYRDFKGPTMDLKLRDADRFNFRTSSGEISREVTLKLKEVSRQLQAGLVQVDAIDKMLHQTIKLIWNHFLNCRRAFA